MHWIRDLPRPAVIMGQRHASQLAFGGEPKKKVLAVTAISVASTGPSLLKMATIALCMGWPATLAGSSMFQGPCLACCLGRASGAWGALVHVPKPRGALCIQSQILI